MSGVDNFNFFLNKHVFHMFHMFSAHFCPVCLNFFLVSNSGQGPRKAAVPVGPTVAEVKGQPCVCLKVFECKL